jgi:hypothetical protein
MTLCKIAEHCYAECHIKAPYAGYRYAECRKADCQYADCRYADCRGAD